MHFERQCRVVERQCHTNPVHDLKRYPIFSSGIRLQDSYESASNSRENAVEYQCRIIVINEAD